MRGVIAVTILCLTSLPAFACVLDSDCRDWHHMLGRRLHPRPEFGY